MSAHPMMDVALAAAQAGGDVVARCFREGTIIRSKDVSNLVSDADLESERTIADVIRRTFPDHAILGEESLRGDVQAEHLWVVDPLDGTNNFAHQIPHFAVSIAYVHCGRAECGVIYNPVRGDWYTVLRGQGASHDGRPARVTSSRQLSEVLIGVGFYYDRGAMMEGTLMALRDLFRRQIHGIRRFGTASLDLCHVGVGMYGAFFEYQLSPWDFAAGRLFVEEAGGRVTTCRGEEPPLGKTSLLASNGPLHESVLEIVRTHIPAEF